MTNQTVPDPTLSGSHLRLSVLHKNQCAKVIGFDTERGFSNRLLELGIVIGAHLQIVHEAPFFRDPIVVQVSGTRFALRRKEVAGVWVSEVAESEQKEQPK